MSRSGLGRPIVHYEIPANDIEKLKKFYSDCFGWTFKDAKIPGMEYWLFTSAKNSPGGGMMKRMDPNHRPVNYVHVESIDTAVQTIQNAGGSIMLPKREIPGGQSFFIAIGLDPEGNPVGLFEAPRQPRKKTRSSRKATKKRKARR